jgi:DnaJ-domain-containing protein 1
METNLDYEIEGEIYKYLQTYAAYEINTLNEARDLLKIISPIVLTRYKDGVFFIDENESQEMIQKACQNFNINQNHELPLFCYVESGVFSSFYILATTHCLYIKGMPVLDYSAIYKLSIKEYKLVINDRSFTLRINSYEAGQFFLLLYVTSMKFSHSELCLPRNNQVQSKTKSVYNPDEIVQFLDNLLVVYPEFIFKDRDVYFYPPSTNKEAEQVRKLFQRAFDSFLKLEIGEIPLFMCASLAKILGKNGCYVTTKGVYIYNDTQRISLRFFDFQYPINIERIEKTFFSDEIYINKYKIDGVCGRLNGCSKTFIKLLNIILKTFVNNKTFDTEFIKLRVARNKIERKEFEMRESKRIQQEQERLKIEEENREKSREEALEREQLKREREEREKNKYNDKQQVFNNPMDSNDEYIEACFILGCDPNDSMKNIVITYKNLAKKYHPDRYANKPKEFVELATREMKKINSAFLLIKKIKAQNPEAQNPKEKKSQEENMYCPNCGNKIHKTDHFCTKCGGRL